MARRAVRSAADFLPGTCPNAAFRSAGVIRAIVVADIVKLTGNESLTVDSSDGRRRYLTDHRPVPPTSLVYRPTIFCYDASKRAVGHIVDNGGTDRFIMAVLCNRTGHYFFILRFILLSSIFRKFGAHQIISTGFASWQRYCTVL